MSAPRPLAVLLVDDSALVLARLREGLANDPLIQIVGTADSGAEAMMQFRHLVPDVVVLDINLPDTSGLSLLRAFKKQRPACKVIMLSASVECREMALVMGADHFCDKMQEFERACSVVREFASRHAADVPPETSSPGESPQGN